MPAPRPQLWHGGAPGRVEGEWLLPPDETGIPVTSRDLSVDAGLDQIAHRCDRVYLTTDRGLAKAWAGIWTPDGERHGGGTLYRVEADVLEPDEDLLSLPGVSFQAPRARVLRVYDPYVAYTPRHLNVLKRILTQHAMAKQAGQRPPQDRLVLAGEEPGCHVLDEYHRPHDLVVFAAQWGRVAAQVHDGFTRRAGCDHGIGDDLPAQSTSEWEVLGGQGRHAVAGVEVEVGHHLALGNPAERPVQQPFQGGG